MVRHARLAHWEAIAAIAAALVKWREQRLLPLVSTHHRTAVPTCVAAVLLSEAPAEAHSAEAVAVPHTVEAHSAEAVVVTVPEVVVAVEAATVTEDVVKILTSAFIIRCTSLIEHDA